MWNLRANIEKAHAKGIKCVTSSDEPGLSPAYLDEILQKNMLTLFGDKPFVSKLMITWKRFYAPAAAAGIPPAQLYTKANFDYLSGRYAQFGIMTIPEGGYAEDNVITFIYDVDRICPLMGGKENGILYFTITEQRRKILQEIESVFFQEITEQSVQAGIRGETKTSYVLDWEELRQPHLPAILSPKIVARLKDFFLRNRNMTLDLVKGVANDHIFRLIVN
jgi:hypothetical protein